MAGLVPAIHVFRATKTWMPGTSSAKTRFALLPGHDEEKIFEQVVGFSLPSFVLRAEASQALTEQAMTVFTDTAGADAGISTAARWAGRALSGVVILFLLFDGAI